MYLSDVKKPPTNQYLTLKLNFTEMWCVFFQKCFDFVVEGNGMCSSDHSCLFVYTPNLQNHGHNCYYSDIEEIHLDTK